MKNVVATIRVETTPQESSAGETMFTGSFIPVLKSVQAGGPPIQCSRACRELELQWPALAEDFAPAPPRARNVPRVRVDPAGFHEHLSPVEKRLLPGRAGGFQTHVSSIESGPVCKEWGDDWVGKVAFHPPVQDKPKR